MPRTGKSNAEKMFGPLTAAEAVKKKTNKIRELSDELSFLALQLTNASKSIGKMGNNSGRILNFISYGLGQNFNFRISLKDTGDFKKEGKMVVLDQITELLVEYLKREAAATYEEIQRIGKEL